MDVRALKPWVPTKQVQPGWHPNSLQAGLTIGAIVAAVVLVVVLFKTGVQ